MKTFAEVFLEKFPDAALDFYDAPYFCVRRVFGQDATECEFDNLETAPNLRDVCNRCWNKIAPKEYQE